MSDWETVYRRTNDPKLSYLEYRLDQMGVIHRRNGRSAHAPILEVKCANAQLAWDLLSEVHDGRTLDDLDDNDPMFVGFGPSRWDEADEEVEWYGELNRGFEKDRM